MNRPWMPLYIADYLRDTPHLRALESGAYLHLIMVYWVSGKLPDDDRQLATIAKMSASEWRRAKGTLAALFGPNWTHGRIDAELKKAGLLTASKAERARQAANARWAKHSPSNAPSIGKACSSMHTSPSHDDDDKREPPLISDASNALADEIAKIVGHDLAFVPPAWCGASYTAQKWLTAGWPREIILASVREQMQRKRGDKPDRITYFEKGIVAAIARHNAPLPEAKIIEGETVNVSRSSEDRSLSGFARAAACEADEIARGHRFRDEGGGSPIRVIPGGKST